jgi:cell wall-associated NlpC family hydrolase
MSSLCKHKKKCNVEINNDYVEKNDNNENEKKQDNNDLIMEFLQQSKDMQKLLMEQNRELQNTVVELSKKQTVTNNYQQNNITNNNNFNLNLFLNEQCKDAINITDFIESIQLTVGDLEATGRLGYVPGISRILVNKLKELDVYTRPLHCTDLKRETVYVKTNNVWEKESSQKNKMRHVIKRIAKKNLQQLPAWQAQNPDFIKLDTPENNDFLKISLNSLGSCDPENEEKDLNKIMRNVLKEVVIDK